MPNPEISLRGYIGQKTTKGATKSGKNFFRFSLATSEWNKEEQKSEYTYWNCSAFGETANRIERLVGEGCNKAVIDGVIMQRVYTDKNGQERHTHDIFVNDYELYAAPTRTQKPRGRAEIRETIEKSLQSEGNIRY